ncbi:DNA-binding PadR family transcriptional regulator [Nocardiopsis arvandica]|uniref:DNA-binding PadR family transcriptional regulator n=1 Tax=Nocardiopsis sinuspersici TaxID=501010 RepID=A0A7Y9X9U4_9ACTN|nr:PadR family transcriptional regulator [Nocardiopsis sinuspersici]NYH51644.1 DNA-binding PadR family transcriptional regulator [Nocardiopsis sinuspersici]
MSTIFGHGRLRLYLLKLLDENPRHGYEIISLLRDRFLGVYSPSPGTIYPRLARLEEEGLVTHTEEGGRKVYRLTDKGREELRERSGDLADLEREITDSVRDIASAVKQDVRATISSLREELKFASGEARRPESGEAPRGSEGSGGSQTSEEAGEASGERRERSGKQGCDEGSRWAREWGRFSQGFGAFGAAWGRSDSERASQAPEFERALRDFGDRVRDTFREAGHVGEAAAGDLRRILDDTVEVIRRDLRHWGPPADRRKEDVGDTGEPAASGEEGTSERGSTSGEGAGSEARPSAGKPAEESAGKPADEPGTRPAPPAGGDPWSQAVDDTGDDR